MMTRWRFTKSLIVTGFFTLCFALPGASGGEDWRAAFDEACAQSNEAMVLSVKELNGLIEKCNRLEKIIETQEETVRKVYLKRLQMCRKLYIFVLETKMKEQH